MSPASIGITAAMIPAATNAGAMCRSLRAAAA